MFVKMMHNIKERRYVPVDWCMNVEDCKIGRYQEQTLEAGVSSVLDEFDVFDFVGVHNTYESLMVDVLDYSLENEECNFDFVDIDNELSAKLMNNEEAACFIFCDGTGESCVFDFEQFNKMFSLICLMVRNLKLKDMMMFVSICSNIMICLIVWILSPL